MNKRYFRIRDGRPDVNGAVIEVDGDAHPRDRLKEFTFGSYRFQLVSSDGGKSTYRVFNESYFTGSPQQGVSALAIEKLPLAIGDGAERGFTLEVDSNGSLDAKAKEGKKVFVSEIDENEARRCKEDAEYWFSLQTYVAGF